MRFSWRVKLKKVKSYLSIGTLPPLPPPPSSPSRQMIESLINMNPQIKGPDTPDAIRQCDAIFRLSLTDNFDPNLNFPNI